MLVPSISTLASSLVNQDNLQANRLKLEAAQTELSTGRYADVNLQLGANVGRNLDWRLNLSETQGFLDSNALAGSKATATQASLESVKSMGNNNCLFAILPVRRYRNFMFIFCSNNHSSLLA